MRRPASSARTIAEDTSVSRREDAKAHVRSLEAVAAELPRLGTARVVAIEGDAVVVEIAGREVLAVLDASVHPTVVQGARDRGERVLLEISTEGIATVVGALHTQPIPGIDRADAYKIEATKVTIEGDEVMLSSKTARIVLRAASEIESFAERIVSRAEGVHKIVGRMLRLN